MDILKINHLSKSFGENKVIDDLSFAVPKHSIFGFLGKNGAGKTTTMKMILGLIKATEGSITVCGEKVSYGNTKTNKYIGYLPDVPEFYGYMTAKEYLKLCGEITGMSKKQIKRKSDELLRLVGLYENNKKIKGFSRGMKQRLGIAQALINEPKLLICDEPTSALDPVGRKEILDILYSIKEKTTVVFSTHILSDAERICDYIGILNNGSLIIKGTLLEIKESFKSNEIYIEFSKEKDAIYFMNLSELRSVSNKISLGKNTLIINTNDTSINGEFLINLLGKYKITPIKFEIMEPTLENLFMEVIK